MKYLQELNAYRSIHAKDEGEAYERQVGKVDEMKLVVFAIDSIGRVSDNSPALPEAVRILDASQCSSIQ